MYYSWAAGSRLSAQGSAAMADPLKYSVLWTFALSDYPEA